MADPNSFRIRFGFVNRLRSPARKPAAVTVPAPGTSGSLFAPCSLLHPFFDQYHAVAVLYNRQAVFLHHLPRFRSCPNAALQSAAPRSLVCQLLRPVFTFSPHSGITPDPAVFLTTDVNLPWSGTESILQEFRYPAHALPIGNAALCLS